MIVAKEIKLKFDFHQPYIKKLGTFVNQTLFSYCGENNFAYTYRYKTLESLAEKIETGRYNSWESLDDLFAASIIIPSHKDEKEVIEFLSNVFKKVILRARGSTLKSPDVFRFDSTRYICRLKPLEDDEDNLIYKINFEVQIRTAFEHAWSIATHRYAYKTKEFDWKILRLTAQLKSTVEQLDMLVSGFSEVHKHITEHKWPELELKLLIMKFINDKVEKNELPEEMVPDDVKRFCENVLSLVKCSAKYKEERPNILLSEILSTINDEIESYDKSMFPRSISLFQLFFGILAKLKILEPELESFYPLITPELEMIFPEVKTFKNRFLFD